MNSRYKKTLRAVAFLALLVSATGVVAEEALVTDRPDITESSLVAGTGRWQLETSMQWASFAFGGVDTETWSMPTLLRIGAGSRLEFRLATDGYSRIQADGIPDDRASGFAPVELGAKYHLRRAGESAISPSLGLLVHLKLPSGSTVFKVRSPESSAILAGDFDLTARLSLGVNAGIEVFENDADEVRTSGLFSAAFGYGLTESTGLFVEFASAGTGLSAEERILLLDGGMTYLFSPNIQVDAAAGFGLTAETDPDLYFTVGFSYRGAYLK